VKKGVNIYHKAFSDATGRSTVRPLKSSSTTRLTGPGGLHRTDILDVQEDHLKHVEPSVSQHQIRDYFFSCPAMDAALGRALRFWDGNVESQLV
jgi:hypothetical protein